MEQVEERNKYTAACCGVFVTDLLTGLQGNRYFNCLTFTQHDNFDDIAHFGAINAMRVIYPLNQWVCPHCCPTIYQALLAEPLKLFGDHEYQFSAALDLE